MTKDDLAAPDNEADCTVTLAVSGNRLVSVLNALDASLHSLGVYFFDGDTCRAASDWYEQLRATTEAMRDELSRQRMEQRR
jgi:hypothetical protein